MGSMSPEQGDSSSAEEVESPRSVVTAAASGRKNSGVERWRRWRKSRGMDRNHDHKEEKCYLHSQVLRIKEEELQIGEYLVGDFAIYKIEYEHDLYDPIEDVWSRTTVLPASPLGSKKNY
ncbi:hypothetical protein BVRB_2g046580 [Beta vulgaris subsp. vulgaris]|nr:hypothetical protein BVRB_2g046580 [Beta vulgaris subsp. vulgaris]